MGLVNNIIVLEKGLRADFMKSFNNAEDPAEIKPFILETTSNTNKEKYGWLGQVPQLTEWKDERKLKGLNEFDYEIPNKHFESTLQVDKDDLDDDLYGMIKTRVSDLARRAKTHPRKLFFELLVNGTTDLCYDGQPFFSASHSEGASGTQSNLYTGTGTSLAQLKADVQGALARMRKYKDDQGEPFNEGSIEIGIVCPPELEDLFNELNTQVQISSSSNSMKGRIKKLVVSSRLTDANDWYIANIAPGIAPIIRQNRQAVKFEGLEKGERAFMMKKIPFGVDYRIGFGYGLWQKMIKVTNT